MLGAAGGARPSSFVAGSCGNSWPHRNSRSADAVGWVSQLKHLLHVELLTPLADACAAAGCLAYRSMTSSPPDNKDWQSGRCSGCSGHTDCTAAHVLAVCTERCKTCLHICRVSCWWWRAVGAIAHAAAAAGAARCWAHLIIHTPLLWVLQHVICLVDLLELVRVTACSRCSMLSDLGVPWCWAGGLPLAAPLSGCSFSASLRCAFFSSSAVASLGTPSRS